MNLTSKQLRQAAVLQGQIETLQAKLTRIVGGNGAVRLAPVRKVSEATKTKMAEAARQRWARHRKSQKA